jgi:hypothetical protein
MTRRTSIRNGVLLGALSLVIAGCGAGAAVTPPTPPATPPAALPAGYVGDCSYEENGYTPGFAGDHAAADSEMVCDIVKDPDYAEYDPTDRYGNDYEDYQNVYDYGDAMGLDSYADAAGY